MHSPLLSYTPAHLNASKPSPRPLPQFGFGHGTEYIMRPKDNLDTKLWDKLDDDMAVQTVTIMGTDRFVILPSKTTPPTEGTIAKYIAHGGIFHPERQETILFATPLSVSKKDQAIHTFTDKLKNSKQIAVQAYQTPDTVPLELKPLYNKFKNLNGPTVMYQFRNADLRKRSDFHDMTRKWEKEIAAWLQDQKH